MRIRGDIERIKYKVLENNELRSMLYEITTEDKIKVFEETGDVDFGYEIPGLPATGPTFLCKSMVSPQFSGKFPSDIMTVEQLGLPRSFPNWPTLPRGWW